MARSTPGQSLSGTPPWARMPSAIRMRSGFTLFADRVVSRMHLLSQPLKL